MPNFTLGDIIERINVITVDRSSGNFPPTSVVDFANEGLRRAKRIVAEFPSREFVHQMGIMTGIERYAIPTGLEDMIGIYDQIRVPDRLNFKRRDEGVFRRDFSGNENTYAIARNKNVKTLLVRLRTISLSTPKVDNTSSLTLDGTWSAVSGTDATNLALDSIHFPNDRTGIKFDIDIDLSVANQAAVEKSDLPAVDLSATAIKRSGMMTMEFYWPSSTLPTSVVYRFGSGSGAYYEITVTSQIDGQPFVQGLNQLGFNWMDVAPVGSPNDASITYERFIVNFPSTIASDVLGVAFSNIVMREKMFVDLHFLSDYLVMDDDGTTLKSQFDDENDTDSYLLIDETFWDWLVYHIAEQLFSFYETDQAKKQQMSMLRIEAEEAMALKSPSRRDPPGQVWMDTEDFQGYMN